MRWIGIMALCTWLWSPLVWAKSVGQTLTYGFFGKVFVYGPDTTDPRDVVIFISGDGGWKQGVVDMAHQLSDQGSVVIGVDIVHYLKSVAATKASCNYAAADFENLSKFIQRKMHFKNYREPLLVGYSSGATLVYALLAQAPSNTFRGGLSLGFCNDLPLAKPLCAKNDLQWKIGKKPNIYLFDSTEKLEDPWNVLNGQDDKICPAEPTKAFVAATKGATIEFLPKVGHGFSVQRNWLPHYLALYKKMVTPAPMMQKDAKIQDLPLIEVLPKETKGDFFSIFISGDGGWAGIDHHIAQDLAAHGIPVIGWNSLQYLWHPKNPDQAARDLERVIEHYAGRLKKTKVRLIGYSLGADLLPFMVSRLNAEAMTKVDRLFLLGPSLSTSFEFHVSDWLESAGDEELPTLPELQKLHKMPTVCVYGEEETDSLCRQKGLSLSRVIPMKGGHHFGGNYSAISKLVMDGN